MARDCLITGGAGFIGGALAQTLVGRRPSTISEIAVVDCLHPQVHPSGSAPSSFPSEVQLWRSDISNAASWDELLLHTQPTTVVHLAAETGTAQSLDVPSRHTETNVTGTARMIEAFDRLDRAPDHVILASSRSVYGEGMWIDPADGHSFAPEPRTANLLASGEFRIIAPSGLPAEPLPQRAGYTPTVPVSVYGATKLTQEHLLRYWCDARGVRLSILRFQNVYGPGQSPHNPYAGIVGLFQRTAAAGKQIEVYEDGQIGRDFIYIDDLVACLAAVIARPPGERHRTVVDAGSGKAITVLEAAQCIARLYGAPEPRVTGKFRFGDVRWAVASTADMRAELGEFSSVSFSEGNERLRRWLHDVGQAPNLGPL